jgi:hypothetical protein
MVGVSLGHDRGFDEEDTKGAMRKAMPDFDLYLEGGK